MAERFDALGDRMKAYEAYEDQKFRPNSWVMLRLDGRGFSKFTKNMERPFDPKFRDLMQNVAAVLMGNTHAIHGYTQSDEISLLYFNAWDSPMIFEGRKQKLLSVTASLAAATLFEGLGELKEVARGLPVFDCRAFELPSPGEAANAILWREQDCRKNGISMAARAHFSHKELQGRKGFEMIDMLKTKRDIVYEEYEARFRLGTHMKNTWFYKEEVAGNFPAVRHKVRPQSRYLTQMDFAEMTAFVTASHVDVQGMPSPSPVK